MGKREGKKDDDEEAQQVIAEGEMVIEAVGHSPEMKLETENGRDAGSEVEMAAKIGGLVGDADQSTGRLSRNVVKVVDCNEEVVGHGDEEAEGPKKMKRGRKPKLKPEAAEDEVKPRKRNRGRKPKLKPEAEEAEEGPQKRKQGRKPKPRPEEEQEGPRKRKRGRKPKVKSEAEEEGSRERKKRGPKPKLKPEAEAKAGAPTGQPVNGGKEMRSRSSERKGTMMGENGEDGDGKETAGRSSQGTQNGR